MALKYDGDATFTPVPGPFPVTKPNALGIPVGTPLDSFVSQVLGLLPNQGVHTELEMPAQFVAGVSIHAAPALKIFADYQWAGWSKFENIRLDFANAVPPDEELVQNYGDTSTVRLGVEVALKPSLRLSGGYIYNQPAAPDETVTPILPEAKRNHMTVGLAWDPNRHWTINTAYQFVNSAERRGRVVNPPSGELATPALNSGVYDTRADLFGVTVTFRR
jgi:long-chain fatty acid transport protein